MPRTAPQAGPSVALNGAQSHRNADNQATREGLEEVLSTLDKGIKYSFQPKRKPIRRSRVLKGLPLNLAIRNLNRFRAQQGNAAKPYTMVIDDEGKGVTLHLNKCKCSEFTDTPCAMLQKSVAPLEILMQTAPRRCCAADPDRCLILEDSCVAVQETLDFIAELKEDETQVMEEFNELVDKKRYILIRTQTLFAYLQYQFGEEDPEIDVVTNCFLDAFCKENDWY